MLSNFTAKILPFTFRSDKYSSRTIRQPSAKRRVKQKQSTFATQPNFYCKICHLNVSLVYLTRCIASSFSQQKTSSFSLQSDIKCTQTIRQPSAKRRVKHKLSNFTARILPFTFKSEKYSTPTIRQPSERAEGKTRAINFCNIAELLLLYLPPKCVTSLLGKICCPNIERIEN